MGLLRRSTRAALLAAAVACEGGGAPPAEDVEEPTVLPDPDPVVEVVDPLPREIWHACAIVQLYWSTVPAALLRTLDSAVTAPSNRGMRDACLVEVLLAEDPDRGDRERIRSPFVAAGWLELYEFRAEVPGERSRVYQNDPIRCRVTERWDVAPPADTAYVPAPWFRQLTACWRRTPAG
jgi:hypothetical protein